MEHPWHQNAFLTLVPNVDNLHHLDTQRLFQRDMGPLIDCLRKLKTQGKLYASGFTDARYELYGKWWESLTGGNGDENRSISNPLTENDLSSLVAPAALKRSKGHVQDSVLSWDEDFDDEDENSEESWSDLEDNEFIVQKILDVKEENGKKIIPCALGGLCHYRSHMGAKGKPCWC